MTVAGAMQRGNGMSPIYRLFCIPLLLWLLGSAAPAQAALDPTTLSEVSGGEATVSWTYKSYNRKAKVSSYQATVSSTSGSALKGPLYLVLESIGGSGATARRPTGITSTGKPYYRVSATDVAPGAKVKVSLGINNPANARLSFTTALYASPAGAVIDTGTLSRASGAQVPVKTTFKAYNRLTAESQYEITVTNATGQPLQGPTYLVLEALSGTGVVVKNAAGVTQAGLAYFVLSPGELAGGAVRSLRVLLANPGNVRIGFTPAVFYQPSVSTLAVVITKPATLITVGSTPLPVEGTVSDGSATLTVNGAPVSISAGKFQANVALSEGHNTVIARAVKGAEEATATISVSLDLTPPYITVDSPLDNAVVSSKFITVSGLINDIVRGTVSEGQANVTVNGKAAAVANRTYSVDNVELVEGLNTLTIRGADQVGNAATIQTRVTYKVPGARRIELVSGNSQKAQIRASVAEPLKVRLLNEQSNPAANTPVVFRVVDGDGAVGVGGPDQGQAVLVQTDASGQAATPFQVGSRAGHGNNRITAKAVGFEGQVDFYASAEPRPAEKVSVNSGNNQRGAASQPLPLPFVVVVTDDGANVLKDTAVRFEATAGGGKFQNGEASYTTSTDSDGRASATLTLGPETGLDAQRATATVVGTTLYAGFTASALVSGDPGQTAVSGVVLDNQDKPLPNVTIRVEGTTRQAKTDAQGGFRITEVPVGPVHLLVDGSTTTVPGEWPTLPYNIVTVAGADNPLSAPVYMVKLDTKNSVWVGKADKVLTLAELPGFALTVKQGSVTFPNGDREGYLSVTPVNASKVPMPPPNGMQPQLIVTIQPTGARFDPPAPLQLPNVDGHAPGAQVEMYSFDHDLEEFVTIGLGTVSADGRVITSNPGVGVIKAGWHCGSQPAGGGCANNCAACQKCDGNCNCVADNSQTPPDVAGDCRKPVCVAGAPAADNSDTPANVAGDCKKPGCENGSPKQSPDASDKPADECKTCDAQGDVTDNKCKICADGQVKDVEYDPTVKTLAYTFGWPNESIKKANDELEKLKKLGVIASISGPSVAGTVSKSECCEPTLGKGEKVSGSISGTLAGFSVKGKVWPIGPIPSWGPKEFSLGIVSFKIKLEFVGGVFLRLDGTAAGTLGYSKNGCSLNAADRAGCLNADFSITLTPAISAELGGAGSLEYDCLGCDPTTISLSASFIFGDLSWPITITGISYNKQDCSSGLAGGNLMANPAEFKVSLKVSGSYQEEGGPTETVDYSMDFLKCTIALSGASCDL